MRTLTIRGLDQEEAVSPCLKCGRVICFICIVRDES